MEGNNIQENVNTTEEMTVFGKIDQKIVKTRKAKAEKKAEKAKAKAAKKSQKEEASTEKKKLDPKVIIAVGAGVLAAAGGFAVSGKIRKSDTVCELDSGEITVENAAIPEKTVTETVES